jgi:hypothetical protein
LGIFFWYLAPCKLVGGLDLEREGPRVDGELGLGVLRHLGGLHSWVLLVSLHVNVVLDKLIVGANLGTLNTASSLVSSCFDLTSLTA